LLKIWNSIPRPVRDSGKAKVWINSFNWDKWQLTQGARLGSNYIQEMAKKVMDLPIHPLSTMSPNTAIVITPENAIVAYDDISDQTNLFFMDMFPKTMDRKYKFILSQRTCTSIPKPGEAVILAPM
jgi:hypothetical protein